MAKNVDWKELTNAQRFREILDDVQNGTEHYILHDNGQARAAMIPLDDLEALENAKQDKEKAWEKLFADLKPVHERNKHFSAEEVDRDVDEAIREMRQ